jgi:hypothetical protein
MTLRNAVSLTILDLVTPWAERSPVVAAMLNPALLATIIAAAAAEYERADGDPMPWPLAFLVAPLVLHRGTRDALPRSTRSHLATWVSNHPTLRAGLPARARSLTDPVREGLRFGLKIGVLTVVGDGRIRGSLPATSRPSDVGDLRAIVRSAGLVGKWFAKVDQPATSFALLGVAP